MRQALVVKGKHAVEANVVLPALRRHQMEICAIAGAKPDNSAHLRSSDRFRSPWCADAPARDAESTAVVRGRTSEAGPGMGWYG